MIVVDTGVLYSFFVRNDPNHESIHRLVSDTEEPLIVSPYVVAELDYLVTKRMGVAAEIALLTELIEGTYVLAEFDRADIATSLGIVETYSDHSIGIADASLVVLADKFNTRKIWTFDRRHFTYIKSMSGNSFDIMP